MLRARRILSLHAEMADLVRLGAYRTGTDPAVDEAIRLAPRIEAMLAQGKGESRDGGGGLRRPGRGARWRVTRSPPWRGCAGWRRPRRSAGWRCRSGRRRRRPSGTRLAAAALPAEHAAGDAAWRLWLPRGLAARDRAALAQDQAADATAGRPGGAGGMPRGGARRRRCCGTAGRPRRGGWRCAGPRRCWTRRPSAAARPNDACHATTGRCSRVIPGMTEGDSGDAAQCMGDLVAAALLGPAAWAQPARRRRRRSGSARSGTTASTSPTPAEIEARERARGLPQAGQPGGGAGESTSSTATSPAATRRRCRAPTRATPTGGSGVGRLLRRQHAAADLVELDALEQGAEIALAEALVALALDELEEDRADHGSR